MTIGELTLFKKQLSTDTNYLEFGSGFSTSLAAAEKNQSR